MLLIATFAQFNAYKDFTVHQTTTLADPSSGAQELQRSVGIGTSMIIIYKIDSLQTDRPYEFNDETSERLSRWRQRFDSRPKYQLSSLTTYCATFCSTSEPYAPTWQCL